MTMGMWSDIDGVGSPTGNRDESLARRIAELYASDEQFGAARPLDEISAAVQLPGMRLPQIVQTAWRAMPTGRRSVSGYMSW